MDHPPERPDEDEEMLEHHQHQIMRAFRLKQLIGFLQTLARQAAWYPDVYNRPELVQCAKCNQPGETQEHLYDCADQRDVEEGFQARLRMLEPGGNTQTDTETLGLCNLLRPWNSLG